ncbi:hydroxypyruvate isomerase family protein [Paenibacillus nasutitermitis]|uniref:Hydroxypyruvate isomerase n=1 Tax=Paenibacillus nasutitermitis TaxID=1652958 RepID=A0A917DRG8_9BACL|nr:TIM barrel protein [Paenibacillus nasutitermitis]GGD61679.1 hydroxypyruvate isomerase [Paenibacillus nasutitermitis]
MKRFAAHLEMNFAASVPFHERWRLTGQFGFTGCEFVWRIHDLADVRALREKHPLQVTCLGGTSGFAVGSGRPVLVWPEDREQLARDVEKAVEYAQAVSCRRLIFVPGNLISGWSLERNRQEAVLSLKYIAPILEQAGITAILEPLNSKVDHKGIYCDTSAEAFRVIEEVGSPNVKVLYDVYHMQIMEGDLVRTISSHYDSIGYYHIAKVSGRTEPIGGEVNFPAVLEAIRSTGYWDYIGLEYKPSISHDHAFTQIKDSFPSYFQGGSEDA